MLYLRCPDCQIVLEFADNISTDSLTCPACNAQFRWDPATEVFTLFYDPETEQMKSSSESAGSSPEDSADMEGDSDECRSPGETLASIAAKRQRYADEQLRDDWRPLRRFFKTFLVIAFLLILTLGTVEALDEGHPLTFDGFFSVVGVSLVSAVGGAALVTAVWELAVAVFGTAWLLVFGNPDRRNGDEIDLDEIADHVKDRVIRRPRTAADSRESGHDCKPDENTNITGVPESLSVEATPPAKDGPENTITPKPRQPPEEKR